MTKQEATQRTALVVGATGLVGSHLLRHVLADRRFGRVVVFGRRPTGVSHAKLIEHIVDFEAPDSWSERVRGDVLFSALGTTIRAAGSRAAQWRVDHTYQLDTARAAYANGVTCCVLISSVGASARSRVFYTRMKGQLEKDMASLGLARLHVLRPGILTGPRSDRRPGEEIGVRLIGALNAAGMFRAYRPIHAGTVSRAMIVASFRPEPIRIYEPAEVFDLAAASELQSID
jgi:uncharacterized protein YbjT (DUF2867 family)